MKTILIADDMAVFREPIAAALRAHGYQTLCAADGKQALALMARQTPDLVLLDLSMPVLDGYQTLQAMKADPGLARIPVILLTAFSDRDQILKAAELGVRDYLLKSQFSLRELLDRVGRRLGSIDVAGSQAAPTPAPPPA